MDETKIQPMPNDDDSLGSISRIFESQEFQYLGPYKVIEEIGVGGMGKVYKAHHPRLNKLVAVKVMLRGDKVHEVDRERFLMETRLTAKLNHPNIVTVYDAGSEGENDYLVMDFIKGKPLSQVLKESNLSIRESLQIFQKITAAIHYAHENKIIHRDLKPGNIIIKNNNQPLIMDFGLAKNVAVGRDLTGANEILGTPKYMAPEQIDNQYGKISTLTDVYALGVILYKMLTKTTPFKGDSLVNIFWNVLYQEPPSLRKYNEKIAIDLEVICHKTIAKKPQDRYSTCGELKEDIKRFLNGEAILACPEPLLKRIQRKIQRNKVFTRASLGLLIIVILTLAAYQIYQYSQNRKKTSDYLNKGQQYIGKASQQALNLLTAENVDAKECQKTIETYIQARYFLFKALELAPQNKQIHQKLFILYKNIGNLALKTNDYLLGKIAFHQCSIFGTKQKASLLQKKLQKKQHMLFKRQQKIIEKIMEKVTKEPHRDMVEWYVTRIARMQGRHVLKKLVYYLKSPTTWQRRVAVAALGKLGDTTTKIKGKDVVEHLLSHLQSLTLKKNLEEMSDIVWAFGWLRDLRAEKPVFLLRDQSGQNSVFWQRTKIPNRWIPLPKQEGADLSTLIRLGWKKADRGLYKQAIAHFDKAIVLNPKFAIAYNSRGVAYSKMGQIERAMVDHSKAIQLDPMFVEAYNNRAVSLRYLKDYDGVIRDCNKAIEIDPSIPNLYNNRGIAYLRKKQKQRAIADFSKAIKLLPIFVDAHYNRGLSYWINKEYDKALADFATSIKLNPRHSRSYLYTGLTYQTKKKYNKALFYLAQAIESNPRATEALVARAEILEITGNLKEAIEVYKHTLKVDPRCIDAYNNRGLIRNALGNFKGALEDYAKALQIEPDNAKVYFNRGVAYHKRKKISKALADYNRAIKFNPKLADVYNNRGVLKEDLGDLDAAIRDYSQAIKRNPKYIQAYENRALVFVKKGKLVKAIKDFSKILKWVPSSITYCNRGELLLKLGKLKYALKDFDRAIKLNKKNAGAYQNRAMIYMKQKQHRKAAFDLKQFFRLNPKVPVPVEIGVYIKKYSK